MNETSYFALPAMFWDKTFPIILGGLITLIVSYFLQNSFFNKQNKAREMNQWLGMNPSEWTMS